MRAGSDHRLMSVVDLSGSFVSEIVDESTPGCPKYVGKMHDDSANVVGSIIAASQAAVELQALFDKLRRSSQSHTAQRELMGFIQKQPPEFWMEEVTYIVGSSKSSHSVALPLITMCMQNPGIDVFKEVAKLTIQRAPGDILSTAITVDLDNRMTIFRFLCLMMRKKKENASLKTLVFEAQKKVSLSAYGLEIRAGEDSLQKSPTALREIMVALANEPENEMLLKIAETAIDRTHESDWLFFQRSKENARISPLLDFMTAFEKVPLNQKLQGMVKKLLKKIRLETWTSGISLPGGQYVSPLLLFVEPLVTVPNNKAVEALFKSFLTKITKAHWNAASAQRNSTDPGFALEVEQLTAIIRIELFHNTGVQPYSQPETPFNLSLFGVWKNPSNELCVALFESAIANVSFDWLDTPVALEPIKKDKKHGALPDVKVGFNYLLEAIAVALNADNEFSRKFVQMSVSLLKQYFSKMQGEWDSLVDPDMQKDFFNLFTSMIEMPAVVEMLNKAIIKIPVKKLPEIKALLISKRADTLIATVEKCEGRHKVQLTPQALAKRNKATQAAKEQAQLAAKQENLIAKKNAAAEKAREESAKKEKQRAASKLQAAEKKAREEGAKKEKQAAVLKLQTAEKAQVLETQETIKSSVASEPKVTNDSQGEHNADTTHVQEEDDLLEPGFVRAPRTMQQPLLGVGLWSDMPSSPKNAFSSAVESVSPVM